MRGGLELKSDGLSLPVWRLAFGLPQGTGDGASKRRNWSLGVLHSRARMASSLAMPLALLLGMCLCTCLVETNIKLQRWARGDSVAALL